MTSDLSPADVAGAQAPSTSSQVTETVARLRRTFRTRRTRSLEWRGQQLRGIERLLTECEHDIADALSSDLGRNAAEAFIGDVAASKAEATFARKNLRKWAKPVRTSLPMTAQPGRGRYVYEPLGLVLVIGPWNYPFYLTLGPLVGALAAGNCVVVKPSEHAPATSRTLARLLPEYLDSEAISVVEGDAEVTQELLAQGLDHAFFTGGTEIGRLIMQAAAPHLTPVTLELGGKSPAVVHSDADVAVAARRITWTKLINSGQTCIAPDYVLADRRVAERLVTEIVNAVAEFRADTSSAGMPIVNRRQFDRLSRLVSSSGGRIALGGGTTPEQLEIEPTVIVDPDLGSEVMGQEIFGPILPVITTDSLDDSINFVNARPKPLGCYLFSKSTAVQSRVLDEISSGGAVINHAMMHCLVPSLPFGGVGESGMGAYHGKWGFQTFSHRKAVLRKPSRPDPSLLYPPYTAKKMAIMRRFF